MLRMRTLLICGLAMVVATAAFAADRELVAPAVNPPGNDLGPCATFTTVNTTPATVSGDNCGGVASIDDYANANCNSVLYPGPEVVFQVNIGAGNNGITMVLTPAAADLGIFMVTTCGVGTSCIAFNDAIGGAAVSDISQLNPPGADQIPPALAPNPYFVYVDSYYAGGGLSCGAFNVAITGTLPVELVEFTID